jgi:hypothetical protein
MSRKPGPQGCDAHSSLFPPRTPGTLGVCDAAEPGAPAELGDTPGTLGVFDGAEQRASSAARRIATSRVVLFEDTTLP